MGYCEGKQEKYPLFLSSLFTSSFYSSSFLFPSLLSLFSSSLLLPFFSYLLFLYLHGSCVWFTINTQQRLLFFAFPRAQRRAKERKREEDRLFRSRPKAHKRESGSFVLFFFICTCFSLFFFVFTKTSSGELVYL